MNAMVSVDTIYDLRLAQPKKERGGNEAREVRRFLRLYYYYTSVRCCRAYECVFVPVMYKHVGPVVSAIERPDLNKVLSRTDPSSR